MTAPPSLSYMFNNTSADAKVQLPLLAELLDGHTRSVLGPLVQPGDTWLDLGAGACTVSSWLAQQVGVRGQVLAVDTNPLPSPDVPDNLTIITGNAHALGIPSDSLQGIHARLLLEHDPQRLQLLADCVDLLAPGGWIVVSDWTMWDRMVLEAPSGGARMLVSRFLSHLVQLGTNIGLDIEWAANANPAFRTAGLVDVQTTTFARTWRGGTGICRLHDSNSRQVEAALIGAGFGRDDLENLRELLADPGLLLSDFLLHTTVGRKPRPDQA